MAAVAGVSAEPLSRPPPGHWRAGVIGEHLYLTYGGTAKGFAGVTAAAQPLATDQTRTEADYGGFGIHALRPRISSGSASARIAGRETLGKIRRKSPRWICSWRLPTKTWARAADCWTISSSDRVRRHKGESLIWCTAGIRSNRFDGGER